MGNQTLARFIIHAEYFDVVGCWDKETPENQFDFYDIYEEGGTCLNEGCPFDTFPTWEELKEYLEENYFEK